MVIYLLKKIKINSIEEIQDYNLKLYLIKRNKVL